MAIDYKAGSGRRGAYENLAKALQKRLDAQNVREAEDQRRKGLFGSGITSQNMRDLASTGMDIAKFGDQRRTEQMNRAREGMERRRKDKFALYERLSTSKNPKMQAAATQLLMDLNKESDRFEDAMTKYEGRGLFDTGFGSESVGYTGANEGETQEGLIARAMKNYGKLHGAQQPIPQRTVEEIADEEAAENEGTGMMAGVTRPVTNIFGEQGRGTGYGPMPGAPPVAQMPTNMQPGHRVDPAGQYALREEDPEYIAKYGRPLRPKAWQTSSPQISGSIPGWKPPNYSPR